MTFNSSFGSLLDPVSLFSLIYCTLGLGWGSCWVGFKTATLYKTSTDINQHLRDSSYGHNHVHKWWTKSLWIWENIGRKAGKRFWKCKQLSSCSHLRPPENAKTEPVADASGGTHKHVTQRARRGQQWNMCFHRPPRHASVWITGKCLFSKAVTGPAWHFYHVGDPAKSKYTSGGGEEIGLTSCESVSLSFSPSLFF